MTHSPIRALSLFLGKSLRRRLVLSMALVNVTLMAGFAAMVVGDERDFLHNQAMVQAQSLADTLASGSVSWVLSDDIAGLGEIVSSMAKAMPDIESVIVTDALGRILAHTEAGRVGLNLVDPASRGLLRGPATGRVLSVTDSVVDVARPIFSGDRTVGWIRVRLSLAKHARLVSQTTREGMLYALLALALGSVLALWTAGRLSRGLESLVEVSDQVRRGVRNVRADESRLDEIGNLGRGFNLMLDQVEATERSLTQTLTWKMKVLENNAAGILVVSGERTVAEANPRFCAMLGCGPDEILGRSTASLHLNRDAYEEFGRTVAQAAGLPEPFTRELRLKRKNGSVFWCEVSGSAFDPADPSKGRTWILIDITDRKIQEQALRESEEKFRTVAEHTYDWEYWTDPQGRFVYCSPSCLRVTGHGAWEFLERPELLAEIIHPEDQDLYRRHVQHVRDPRTDQPLTLEFRILTPHGEVRTISHTCVAVSRDDERWWGRRSCNRDITLERRTAERIEKLNACFLAFGPDPEANIRLLVALAGQFVEATSSHFFRGQRRPLDHVAVWSGADGVVRNPRPDCDVVGCMEEVLDDMHGEYCENAVAGEGRTEEFYVCQRVIWAGGTLGGLCLRLPQRRELDPSQQRFLGILAMAIGVEEERRLSQAAVTAALEEKNILIKEIHHRVKNNMQVMSSLISLQCANFQDENSLELFKECESRILAMALVHEELYTSEDLANVDFAHYVRRLTGKLVNGLTCNDRVTVRLSLDQVFLPVDMSIPCGLIFNELFTNALKHAFPEGNHGAVDVRLSARDNQARLTVQDDGVGLPGDFDLHAGATLGLELVTSLADQLGGSVHAEPTIRGASLNLTFPLRAPKGCAPPVSASHTALS
ncbi:hypothetical protein JCM15519_12030 [Fundidesulfovibrio butyratiphilus]